MSNETSNAERRGRVDANLDDLDETVNDDHEPRITRLEKFMWLVVGALASLSTIVGSAKLTDVLGLV